MGRVGGSACVPGASAGWPGPREEAAAPPPLGPCGLRNQAGWASGPRKRWGGTWGPRGCPCPEPLQAYEPSPLLWSPGLLDCTLQGLKESSGPRTLGPAFLGWSFSFHQCSALTPDIALGPAYLEASRSTPLPQMTGGFGDRNAPGAHLGVAPVGYTLPAEQVAAGCGRRMPAFLQAQRAQWVSGNCSFLCMVPGGSGWMGHN